MNNWIEKQRYLIDFSLSSLYRRKGKNLALLIVYIILVFMLASVMFFSHALKQEAQRTLISAPEIVLQKMKAGRHEMISSRYLDEIRNIRGVSKVKTRLWGYFYDPVTKSNYTLSVSDSTWGKPGEIKIGNGIARARQASEGDVLSLRSTHGKLFSFKIKEIFSLASELVTADLILVREEDFRDFFGLSPELYTDFAISVRNPSEVLKIAQKIVERVPDSRPILRTEMLRTYDSIFNWRQGIVFVILCGAVLAFAILAWDKASGLSAEERQEIGILKAIGWDTSDVIKMKFWEGGIVSLIAFLIGTIAAYLHIFYSSAVIFEPVLKGWAVLYPQFRLLPHIEGLQIATLFFFTVIPYLLATIFPIWRTAVIDPDTVMR